jgi:hypothetical protein
MEVFTVSIRQRACRPVSVRAPIPEESFPREFRGSMVGSEGAARILGRNAAQGDCCLTFRELGVCGDIVKQFFGCKLDSGAK